jgi:gas vesicle protein
MAVMINYEGAKQMIHENQDDRYPINNAFGVLVGMLLGGLVGAVTMLLLAPQSGKDTRKQIRKRGVKLRDRTTEMVDDTMAQVRSSAKKITTDGREAIKELAQHGQKLAVEQLDHVSEAAKAGKKAIQNSY